MDSHLSTSSSSTSTIPVPILTTPPTPSLSDSSKHFNNICDRVAQIEKVLHELNLLPIDINNQQQQQLPHVESNNEVIKKIQKQLDCIAQLFPSIELEILKLSSNAVKASSSGYNTSPPKLNAHEQKFIACQLNSIQHQLNFIHTQVRFIKKSLLLPYFGDVGKCPVLQADYVCLQQVIAKFQGKVAHLNHVFTMFTMGGENCIYYGSGIMNQVGNIQTNTIMSLFQEVMGFQQDVAGIHDQAISSITHFE